MNIGDTWKDYTIDTFLGEGTFGKVYKIVRKEFGHTYESALKVIRIPPSQSEYESVKHEGMEDKSITTYFRSMVDEIISEFSIMSELRGNSNIVSYEDHSVTPLVDSFGWEICIRMELLTPLYKYLKDHTLSVRDIIQLGTDMCKALEVCQQFNLIHRDIKPENIFVSNINSFKLGDFGIARQMEKTSAGMSKKGTYSYMAPEVYKGEHYDTTADIYSLGIVLYRFLNNNRTPFMPPYPQPIRYSDRENANSFRMKGTPIPPPCNAPDDLARIILKACAFNPTDRYQSPADMRAALEALSIEESANGIIYPAGFKSSAPEAGSVYFSGSVSGDSGLYNDETLALFSTAGYSSHRNHPESTSASGTYSNTVPPASGTYSNTIPPASGTYSNTASGSGTYQPSASGTYSSTVSSAEQAVFGAAGAAAVKGVKASASGTVNPSSGPDPYITDFMEEPTPDFVPEFTETEATEYMSGFEEEATLPLDFGTPRILTQDAASPEAEAQAEKKQPDKKKGKKKKKAAVTAAASGGKTGKGGLSKGLKIALACAAALILGAGFGFYKYNHHLIPDLAGMPSAEAKAAVEDAGLSYTETSAFSEDVPRGSVISQEPAAGGYEKKGDSVAVTISKGKAIPAPDFKGKSMKDAESAAGKAGLAVEVEKEEYSDSVAADHVISQDIEPGTDCEEGQVIKVVKSKGKEQIAVPDVIGKTVDDATKALEDAGFKVAVVNTYSSSTSGTIVDQSVAGGEKTDKGAEITISKSIGPKPAPKKKTKKKSKKKSSGGGGDDDDWDDYDWDEEWDEDW